MVRTHAGDMAQIRVWLCAKGLRAQAELAALARARRDGDAVRDHLGRARTLLATAHDAEAEAASVTPNAGGWRALAEGEYQRPAASPGPTCGPRSRTPGNGWSARRWGPTAAGARPRRWSPPAPPAPRPAGRSGSLRRRTRIGAAPLAEQLSCSPNAHGWNSPRDAGSPDREGLEELLDLTPREAEVLALLTRGYTNREIAAALVISVRTAGVHVSHILRKLGAPNRREAAAIAHRPHHGPDSRYRPRPTPRTRQQSQATPATGTVSWSAAH